MKGLSNVYGRIEHILLTFPGANSAYLESYYDGILKALTYPDYTILAAFTEKAVAKRMVGRAAQRVKGSQEVMQTNAINSAATEPRVIVAPIDRYIIQEEHAAPQYPYVTSIDEYRPSKWAQDPFVVLTNDEGISALLESIQFRESPINRIGEQLVADHVAAYADFFLKPFPLQLEGGNILVGDDYVLIGKDTLCKNAVIYDMSVKRVTEYFAEYLGIERIIWVGSDSVAMECAQRRGPRFQHHQPLPHIDSFLNLGGKTQDGREIVLVGDITEESCFASGASVRILRRFKRRLDAVAENLQKLRMPGLEFAVERIPIIVEIQGKDVFFYPYNNCLVEIYGAHKNVYLPRFHRDIDEGMNKFGRVENTVTSIFERLGFHVTMVDNNFADTARSYGVLRCMTKVLQRSLAH